ncbi:MAG: type 1 glutamine amidotransferase [Patescibacteria group bacterium]
MKNKIKILYLDILTDNPETTKEINRDVYKSSNYSEAMRRAFSLSSDEWVDCYVPDGKFPEDFSSFDGVVIGGSTEDPIKGREKPWMVDSHVFIKKIAKAGIPILGICGGLQFVVRAFGKKLILNPKGRELGTKEIKLTKDGAGDLLFKGLPKINFVQLSHKVMADDLKPEWKLLATSKLCNTQAIAIGDKIRLTQFHPEMKADELKALIKSRKSAMFGEGIVKNEKEFRAFLSAIKSTAKVNKQILKNFLNYFVLPYSAKRVDK